MLNFTNDNNNDNNNNSNIGGNGIGGIGGIISPPMMPSNEDMANQIINDLLINYNEKYKNDDTLFRENITKQTIATLIAKTKPNVLLIGEAGVGKTKIVESLAHKIENKHFSIPTSLQNTTIYELPLSNIVAGSSIVGQLEEKLKMLIEYIKNNNAILFIDEIHQLFNKSSTYENIAQILKPYLSRGEIKVIGATTLQESNKLLNDPAFNRRFSRLLVDELTKEQTLIILENILPNLISFFKNKVFIQNDLLKTVLNLAETHKPSGSHRPDNAITLLENTLANAIVENNYKLEKLKKQDQTLYQQYLQLPYINITENMIKNTAIKLMTGNATQDDFSEIELRDNLASIKGQDHIIDRLVNKLNRWKKPLFSNNQPLSFLFAGTSGVGKTEVVKILAKTITKQEPIIINMTEYHSSASINRIIGSPSGYIGSDSNSELPFDSLQTNPYKIILLDEFEKGHPSVQALFMSALDEGYIKTNKNVEINFSKAIIIATTNASHTDNSVKKIGFKQDEKDVLKKEQTINELKNYFPIELLNRFNDIITFNEISKDIYKEIIKATYEREVSKICNDNPKYNNKLAKTLTDDEVDEIADNTYIKNLGARPIKNAVREKIESLV